MREHVFNPAGMSETFVLDGTAKLPPNTVKGYATDSSGKAKRSTQPTTMTGDGNINTSVRDFSRWDAALRAHKIISAESLRISWQNGRLDNGKPIEDADGNGYGYGWVIEKPAVLVSHSGSWDGTSTYVMMDLKTGLTVAVLSNDENTECEELAVDLAALFADD
ncbi:MAG: serine hydrolase domain-containing protein [Chthoniobacterales bacterium]